MSEFTNANSNSRYQIIIDISEQRLYLFEKDVLKQSFPVSTSSFGEGSIENSFKFLKSANFESLSTKISKSSIFG